MKKQGHLHGLNSKCRRTDIPIKLKEKLYTPPERQLKTRRSERKAFTKCGASRRRVQKECRRTRRGLCTRRGLWTRRGRHMEVDKTYSSFRGQGVHVTMIGGGSRANENEVWHLRGFQTKVWSFIEGFRRTLLFW